MTTTVKIVAIFPEILWPEMEELLLRLSVRGLSLTPVKGFGSYRNYFRKDLLSTGLKLEIYTTSKAAKTLTRAIESFIDTHAAENGLVAVEPVIRTNIDLNSDPIDNS
ncbi:MAG: transcriptional regulator [Pseudomonadota bacterium]|uniref:P-II family nitrogen regulator n=1 Tax=Gallaecimonas pentaromativorans TaxID=584787 RepID=UPI00067F407D|nr:transcriptional regulator [Gallaecimonas pentaromativorans]MED5523716.1 transcriptional regulator [Pseudomonadota bacterium]